MKSFQKQNSYCDAGLKFLTRLHTEIFYSLNYLFSWSPFSGPLNQHTGGPEYSHGQTRRFWRAAESRNELPKIHRVSKSQEDWELKEKKWNFTTLQKHWLKKRRYQIMTSQIDEPWIRFSHAMRLWMTLVRSRQSMQLVRNTPFCVNMTEPPLVFWAK